MKLSDARALAQNLADQLAPACDRIEIAGSIRRECPEVGDIELVAIPRWEERQDPADLFGESTLRVNLLWEACGEVLPEGTTWLKSGRLYRKARLPDGMKIDLFSANPDNWGIIQAIRTGSAGFSQALVTYSRKAGYPVHGGHVRAGTDDGPVVPMPDEATLFELLGLEPVEPPQRTGPEALRRIRDAESWAEHKARLRAPGPPRLAAAADPAADPGAEAPAVPGLCGPAGDAGSNGCSVCAAIAEPAAPHGDRGADLLGAGYPREEAQGDGEAPAGLAPADRCPPGPGEAGQGQGEAPGRNGSARAAGEDDLGSLVDRAALRRAGSPPESGDLLFVIDLEATGRCPESGGVWEIACVAVRGGEIVGDFATSVWPGRRYLNVENLALVEKLTGIAPADLLPVLLRAATPNVAMAKTALLKWISRQAGFSYEWAHLSEGVPPRPVVLTSFNTQFDRRFLDSRDWNIAWALAATTGVQIEWDLCVMLEARTHMLQAGAIAAGRSPSLADACRHFGIPFEVKHRALPDARAAAQLAIALGLTTATTTTAKQAA